MNMNLDKNILGIQFLNEKVRRLFLKLYSTKNRQIDKNGEKKMKNIPDNLAEKMNEIKGQELKYGPLCESLGLSKKGGYSKQKQLEDLALYCDLQILSSPTRYRIDEVYENEIKAFSKLNKNNKYQNIFDAIVYQTFQKNNGRTLFLSNTELLKLFGLVNDNFIYSCNIDTMSALGNEYINFPEISATAKKILVRWTLTKLENMAKRDLIRLSSGYRLYSEHYGHHGYFILGHNVPLETDLDKQCMALLSRAKEIAVPGYENGWLSDNKYKFLNKTIKELCAKEFDDQYIFLKKVITLSPPTESRITEKLQKIYQEFPELKTINQESYRKIMSTKQLDSFSGETRRKFSDINIKLEPNFLFKDIIKRDV